MIAAYLEHALEFEALAKREKNPSLKDTLLQQAEAYRKLAAERAVRLGLSMPEGPANA